MSEKEGARQHAEVLQVLAVGVGEAEEGGTVCRAQGERREEIAEDPADRGVRIGMPHRRASGMESRGEPRGEPRDILHSAALDLGILTRHEDDGAQESFVIDEGLSKCLHGGMDASGGWNVLVRSTRS